MPLNGHNSARQPHRKEEGVGSTPLVQDFLFLSLFALFLFFMYLLSFSLLTGRISLNEIALYLPNCYLYLYLRRRN